mmetsp:Transcript_17470/g.26724  ORF Transcript_17470/g.26724 Transcript_17470/m.26724 type:complete len:267 (+) Transcript_17470:89-889(+)
MSSSASGFVHGACSPRLSASISRCSKSKIEVVSSFQARSCCSRTDILLPYILTATTSASAAICLILEARSPRSSSEPMFPKLSNTALHALIKSGGGTSGNGFCSSGTSPDMALSAFSAVPGTIKASLGVNAFSNSFSLSVLSSVRSNLRRSSISLEALCLSFSSIALLFNFVISWAGPFAPASLACCALASNRRRNGSSIFPSFASLMRAPSILIGSPRETTAFRDSAAADIRFDCSEASASRRILESSSPLSTCSVKSLTNCASN